MTNRHMPYPAHPVLGFLVAQKDLAAGYCSAVRYLVQDVNATYEWESSRLHDDESYWLVVADIATEFHETVNEVVDELTKIAIDGQRKIDAIEFDRNNVALCLVKQKAMEDVASVWMMADRIWHLANDGDEYFKFVEETLEFLRIELENARKWRDEAKQKCSEEESLLEAEFGG